jgi:DNA-binding SARP family transcriptional activator
MTPSSVRVGVLGSLTLRVDGVDTPFPPGRPGRALGSLLLAGGRVVSDSRLSDDVWGEEQPDDPRAALHTTVARVRRSLGTAGSLVVRHGHGYLLDRRSVVVDSDRFLDLVARARTADTPTGRVGMLDQALGLWRGAAWAELAADLAVGEARRLEEAQLAAREERAAALLEAGEVQAAVGDPQLLVAEHWLPIGWQGVIRCASSAGQALGGPV